MAPRLPGLPTPVQVQQAIRGAFEALGRDLNRLLTIRAAVTPAANPAKGWNPQPGDIIVGNIANKKYWENQGDSNTCVLMSTAMVIGQLTGKMPSKREIVAEAANTPSAIGRTGIEVKTQRTRNGMIYQTEIDEFVYYADSLQILYNHKIAAKATYYTNDQADRAMNDLVTALGNGESVIVTINSDVRESVIADRGAFTGGTVTADHAVTVIAVNVTQKKVYINDTALDPGQGNPLELSYEGFTKIWQPSQYTLITAHVAAPGELSAPAQLQPAA
ncbi:C39 family peptidase [Mycobacterium sp. shizuoka-1]|uniref:C39 family peptidase n=1 Tax=Mycobacterium sp. shizuoka-1 TaxID=2039281 RepID=UPI001304794A|nr:C39 family peptidase [Mycobacterium sp. shizuoka-1]